MDRAAPIDAGRATAGQSLLMLMQAFAAEAALPLPRRGVHRVIHKICG